MIELAISARKGFTMGLFSWLRKNLGIEEMQAQINRENMIRFAEIHRHLIFVRLDLLLANANKIDFSEEKFIELITEYPVAADSYDHLYPLGTIHDNTRCPSFFRKLESIFPEKKSISFLDLGCAGGGLVLDALLRGHFGIGLEGSDASLLRQRAEWRLLRNNLFTCDIKEEFVLRDKRTGETKQFDAISAWEVLEHLPEHAFPRFFSNVKNHLSRDGRFFASVASFGDAVNGVNHHVTIKPRDWWEKLFLRNDFILEEPLEPEFRPRGGYNPPLCYQARRDLIPENFSFTLSKRM